MHSGSPDRKSLIVIFVCAVLLLLLSYAIQFSLNSQSFNAKKIAELVRLFPMMLLFTGATLYLTGISSNETIRRNSFSLAIGAGATALLVGYRFLIGSGIGLHPVSFNELASGFLYYPEDNFEYAAWAIQSEKGALLFRNLYTLDHHRALYFNPFFLLIGITARIFPVSVIPFLIVIGIFSSIVLIILIAVIFRELRLPERAGRWATLLAAFSSGISVPVYYLGKWIGIDLPVGSDLRYLDSVLFSTFYALPYHSFAFMLQGFLVWLIYRCERDHSTLRDFGILAGAQLLSAFTRPYEWVLVIIGYSLYLGLTGQVKHRKRLRILFTLAAAAAPAVLYNWWLSQQPVWETFAQSSLNQQKFRLYWLFGYGLTIPLTMVGAFVAWKHPGFEKARWFSSTACLVILLLVFFNIREAKLAACGHFFLCLSSGVGIHHILTLAERQSVLVRNLLRLAFIPGMILLFGTSLFLMVAYFHTHKIDSEMLTIGKAIGARSSVLCSEEDGEILPALSGAHVYSGQWALTPQYSFKKRVLTEAGLETNIHGSRDSLNKLIGSENFDYALIRKDRPAYEWIRTSAKARLIACYSRRCLFALM
jgi:hypothetical protein